MPRVAAPKNTGVRKFVDEDAYKTWRVIAPNNTFTGETETFGFSNGQASIVALPKSVRCRGLCDRESGDLCRVHSRVFHLNNLLNYPTFHRITDERTGRRSTEMRDGYRVLSEEEYEREFGDNEEDMIDLGDF